MVPELRQTLEKLKPEKWNPASEAEKFTLVVDEWCNQQELRLRSLPSPTEPKHENATSLTTRDCQLWPTGPIDVKQEGDMEEGDMGFLRTSSSSPLNDMWFDSGHKEELGNVGFIGAPLSDQWCNMPFDSEIRTLEVTDSS